MAKTLPECKDSESILLIGSNPTTPLHFPELCLEFCSRNDQRYVAIRDRHYVKNKGVHAQQVHFLIRYNDSVVGIISGSSAVYATPARDIFFGITKENREKVLRGIINNIVFRLEYRKKNLASRVLAQWRQISATIWEDLYHTPVYGFETLVIPDRTKIKEGGIGSELDDPEVEEGDFEHSLGGSYKADNWTLAGMTEGNTKSHDQLGLNETFVRRTVKPKAVWCKWRDGYVTPVESEVTATWQASKKWNDTLERHLKRTMPDITEQEWVRLSGDLKLRAKTLASKRLAYIGKTFLTKGKHVLQAV
jgi:hypothetical protein